jgi:hypothetical protein
MELAHAYSDDQMLTWEEYEAGERCRGCGSAFVDDEPWNFRGTMQFSDAERQRYEAEDARCRAAHQTCGAYRWTVSRSITTHCGRCCPPPPLSPQTTPARVREPHKR